MQSSIFHTALGNAIRRTSPSLTIICPSVKWLHAVSYDSNPPSRPDQYRIVPASTETPRRSHLHRTERSTEASKDHERKVTRHDQNLRNSPVRLGDRYADEKYIKVKQPSRRKRKANRASPSSLLSAALASVGLSDAVPPDTKHKADLSYTNAFGYESRRAINAKRFLASRNIRRPVDLSLVSITANYIRKIHSETGKMRHRIGPAIGRKLEEIFNPEAKAFLERKGYTAQDVKAWAWVLTAPYSENAAERLFSLATTRRLPTFLFMYLLRREHITPRAFRLMLLYAWMHIGHGRAETQKQNLELEEVLAFSDAPPEALTDTPTMNRMDDPLDESTVMIMAVRLLRHARQVWPQALTSIANLVSKYLIGKSSSSQPEKAELSIAQSSRLTDLYNRLLSLLALPSSKAPFRFLRQHQNAQFVLLRAMASFKPPLSITREGYRAMIRTQLAHKKTGNERRWALMKAKSWPPWREERTGMDVGQGIEEGISRASQALSMMKEAGYSENDVDKAGNIFAGWDTDGSPTIQTRSMVARQSAHVSKGRNPEDGGVWCARIRATRTVDEAWMCFLSARASNEKISQKEYHAMFEKLVYETKRLRSSTYAGHEDINDLEVVPGDGFEVFAGPSSPREAVYLHTPVPSIEQFFNQMIDRGIRPHGPFLAFLIKQSRTVEEGIKYLRASKTMESWSIDFLAFGVERHEGRLFRQILLDMPELIFTAFVELLCSTCKISDRTSFVARLQKWRPDWTQDSYCGLSEALQTSYHSPLNHAFKLISIRQPKCRTPWNFLLHALARRYNPERQLSLALQVGGNYDWSTYQAMEDLLALMDSNGFSLDLTGFHHVCMAMEKVVINNLRSESAEQKDPKIEKALKNLRERFEKLVGIELEPRMSTLVTTNSDWSFPSLLSVPLPAHLHAFSRVLGLFGDYDSLVSLLRWMARYSTELEETADEVRNGRRLLRRTLICSRAFLERDFKQHDVDSRIMKIPCASSALIKEAREVIQSKELWGGWPDDQEVEVYCRHPRAIL